jgi:hypothetical protein
MKEQTDAERNKGRRNIKQTDRQTNKKTYKKHR